CLSPAALCTVLTREAGFVPVEMPAVNAAGIKIMFGKHLFHCQMYAVSRGRKNHQCTKTQITAQKGFQIASYSAISVLQNPFVLFIRDLVTWWFFLHNDFYRDLLTFIVYVF
ncbi:MAG: hypothetical protein KFH87_05705, partial [Bacteroidetes bacterium]|nr:hypothetical protein [Bacteroidota bacterium]